MKSKIRRINLYGGPGAGKSTNAARIFAELKLRNYSVEAVHEYVKAWTYMDKPVEGFDQVYLFAKQMYKEETILRSGVDLIVTDAPLYLTCFYSKMYAKSISSNLVSLASAFEEEYPSLNIIVKRPIDKVYDTKGRYQTELESKEFDEKIRYYIIYDVMLWDAMDIDFTKHSWIDEILEEIS